MHFGLILVLVLIIQPDAFAQTTLRVAIKPLAPFVMKSGSGFEGYSIDLWNTIAAKNGWQTRYTDSENKYHLKLTHEKK